MEFKTYTRTPFAVEAVEITEDNIDEIAALIGSVRTKDGVKTILVDRKIVPNIGRAGIGWFVTKMDDKYRCYAPKLFSEQFIPVD